MSRVNNNSNMVGAGEQENIFGRLKPGYGKVPQQKDELEIDFEEEDLPLVMRL